MDADDAGLVYFPNLGGGLRPGCVLDDYDNDEVEYTQSPRDNTKLDRLLVSESK